MSLNVFFLSVLASVIGAAVYAIFFSKREDVVRTFLAKTHSGWRRRRYVRIFIHAVRGEARAGDTRTLANLFLIYPLAFMLVGWYLYSANQRNIDAADELLAEIHNPQSVDDAEPRTPKDAESELRRILSSSRSLRLQALAVLIGAHIWYFWMIFVRQPFVVFRSRFAHELDRFLLRIQGLASKNELAELAQLEAKVRDEESASSYVTKMASIARRYHVEHLVDTFLLWGPVAAQDDA